MERGGRRGEVKQKTRQGEVIEKKEGEGLHYR